ncbi:Os01g0780400, partial [Oryza sativa Japonica Group]
KGGEGGEREATKTPLSHSGTALPPPTYPRRSTPLVFTACCEREREREREEEEKGRRRGCHLSRPRSLPFSCSEYQVLGSRTLSPLSSSTATRRLRCQRVGLPQRLGAGAERREDGPREARLQAPYPFFFFFAATASLGCPSVCPVLDPIWLGGGRNRGLPEQSG